MKKTTTEKKAVTKKHATKKAVKKELEYFIVYEDKNRKTQNLITKCSYKINGSRDNLKQALVDLMRITNGNFQAIVWFCEVK